MVEFSTAAKGAGGVLVLGGGGTGVYYAGKAYESHRVENLSWRDYISENERMEKDVVFIDSLNDTDEYLKTLGKAYRYYVDVYFSGDDKSVLSVNNKISTASIVYKDGQYEDRVGKIVRDWCKEELKKKNNSGNPRIQYWCVKRTTNLERVQKEDPKKAPKTLNTDFSDEDYKKVTDKLESMKLEHEKWKIESLKSIQTKGEKGALLGWCENKIHFLFFDDEQKHYELFRDFCFKDK